MYNIIPLVIILVALAVIVYIVLRRLSHISSIDAANIPAEIVQKTKARILDERLKRRFSSFGKKLQPLFGGVSKKMEGQLEQTKAKLESMKKKIEKDELPKKPVTREDFEKHQEFIEEQLEEAQDLAIQENFEDAEKRFIEVISHDPKNSDAYMGLAELYVENKKYTEAIETYKFLHKLLPDSAKVLADLADVYESTGQNDQMLDALKQAIILEPRNPKFLDKIISIYIQRADKLEARRHLEMLAEVNPENQKLEDLQNQIDEL